MCKLFNSFYRLNCLIILHYICQDTMWKSYVGKCDLGLTLDCMSSFSFSLASTLAAYTFSRFSNSFNNSSSSNKVTCLKIGKYSYQAPVWLVTEWSKKCLFFSTCRLYRDRQKPANKTQCPTLITDS